MRVANFRSPFQERLSLVRQSQLTPSRLLHNQRYVTQLGRSTPLSPSVSSPARVQVSCLGCKGAYRLVFLQVGLSAFHINLFLGRKFSADPIGSCQNGLQCTWRASTEKLARDPCTLRRLRKNSLTPAAPW